MACGLCEVHCIVKHSKNKDIRKAFRQVPRALSRIRVEKAKPISFAIQCQNCDNPPCVAACLSGAMQINEYGTVIHLAEKCIGCWTCIMVCPFNAIIADFSERVAIKCDFCADLDTPACVLNCPNEALVISQKVMA